MSKKGDKKGLSTMGFFRKEPTMVETGNKRGLSTIVATLLIVLLVLVAIAIVWAATRNVIQVGNDQITLGKINLNLEIRGVTRNVADNSINVKIKRNPGKGELSGIEFISDNGESTEIVRVENVSLNELDEQTFDVLLNSDMSVTDLEKISVAPVFISESGKEIVGDISDVYVFSGETGGGEAAGSNCLPDCIGKICGDNGCGGVCGTCSNGDVCNSVGQCVIPISIGACGNLLIAGTTYILNQNVTSIGTCFNITAKDITLDCNNNWISYSSGDTPYTYGVNVRQSNATIKNCNIINIGYRNVWGSTFNYGIYILNSNNSNLINNKVMSNLSSGIYIYSSLGNTLRNNTVKTTSQPAIYIYSSSNNSLLVNNLGESNDNGISFYLNSNNNVLINNIGRSNSGRNGIDLSKSSNNTLINNIGESDTAIGISLYLVKNSTLINNIGRNRINSYGMGFSETSNNLFINNLATSNSGFGMTFYSSINDTFINNTATSGSSQAIHFGYSLNDLFINQTAKTLGTTVWWDFGICIQNSNNTIFRDCNIEGAVDVGYNMDTGRSASVNNTFINCPYDTENVIPGNQLIRKWYYKTQVKDGSGNAISGASVSAFNNLNVQQFSVLTDSSGLTQAQEVIDYINTAGTKLYYNNYIINASKTGYTTGTHTFNFTTQQNKVDDLFTLA